MGGRAAPSWVVNQAAWLLAQLCSGTRRFPPGDVSAAVIDAVAVSWDEETKAAERKAHADLLRDIFGPALLRTPAASPTWQTPEVVALAQAAYEVRQLPGGLLDPTHLAVLADALAEAGVADEHLLGHLRRPGRTFAAASPSTR